MKGYEESVINQIKVVPALFWLYHWWNSAPLLLSMFTPRLRDLQVSSIRPCWHCLNLWIQKLLSNVGTECLHFNRKNFFFFLFYPLWSETWHRKIPQSLKIVQQETGHVCSDPKSPYTLLKYRHEREGSQLLSSALLPTEVTGITMSHPGITAGRSAQSLTQGRGIRQRYPAYWVAWCGLEFHVPNPIASVLPLTYKRDNSWLK